MAKKMKSYDSFDLWFEDQSKTAQALIKPIRKLINGGKLEMEESVKYGNGVWISKKNLPVVYIYAEKKSIQVGYFPGSLLKDPKKLLSGKGKFIRFFKIADKSDINTTAILKFAREASKIEYR